MGNWGTGILDGDTEMDAHDDYVALRERGTAPDAILAKITACGAAAEAGVIAVAVAAAALERGELTGGIRAAALAALADKGDACVSWAAVGGEPRRANSVSILRSRTIELRRFAAVLEASVA
jgi:hypothetical protein